MGFAFFVLLYYNDMRKAIGVSVRTGLPEKAAPIAYAGGKLADWMAATTPNLAETRRFAARETTETETDHSTEKSRGKGQPGSRLQTAAARVRHGNSAALFFLQWLRAPGRMGAVVPSSRRLADAMAHQIPHEARHDSAPIVELGGGTGSITRGILDVGIPPQRLIVLERDPALADLLAKRFRGIHVLCGDAQHLHQLLAERGIHRVAAVVSGLPLLLFPEEARRQVVDACFAVLAPGRPLIQFTYGFNAPLPPHEHHLHARRVARVLRNVPPAFVWTFKKS